MRSKKLKRNQSKVKGLHVRFASTAFFGATPCGMGKAGSAKAFATCLLLQCQDGSEKIVLFFWCRSDPCLVWEASGFSLSNDVLTHLKWLRRQSRKRNQRKPRQLRKLNSSRGCWWVSVLNLFWRSVSLHVVYMCAVAHIFTVCKLYY